MSFKDYLDMELTKRGFWSPVEGCWTEINPEGEEFENVVAEVGQKYIPEENEKFDFEVECDHVFESSGYDLYAVAVAYAFTMNNEAKPVAQSILYTTCIY